MQLDWWTKPASHSDPSPNGSAVRKSATYNVSYHDVFSVRCV